MLSVFQEQLEENKKIKPIDQHFTLERDLLSACVATKTTRGQQLLSLISIKAPYVMSLGLMHNIKCSDSYVTTAKS